MATIGLFLGLCWRLIPGASPPSLYALLDVCGIALWLSGWPMAIALIQAMHRRSRYLLHAEESLARLSFIGMALVGLALMLSLSPSSLLLAYSPRTILQTLSTQDIAQINVSIGLVWTGTLLLGGTLYVLASCTVALLALRTGRLAPLTWLLISVYLQLSVLGGLGEHIPRIEPGGETIPSWVPLTLGLLARNAMARLADPGIRYEYANPLADSAVAGAVAGIVVLTAACLWLSARIHLWRIQRNALPLSTGAALLCLATNVVGQLWVYTVNPGVAAPGSWQAVISMGPVVACLMYWIWSSQGEVHDEYGSVVWQLAVIAGSIALTTPHISAGQGSQVEVLWHVALLLAPFMLTMQALQRIHLRGGTSLKSIGPLLSLLAIVVPLNGRDNLIGFARQWAMQGVNGYVAAGLICLLLLVWAAQWNTRAKVEGDPKLRPAA
jgi:hypothetical protein